MIPLLIERRQEGVRVFGLNRKRNIEHWAFISIEVVVADPSLTSRPSNIQDLKSFSNICLEIKNIVLILIFYIKYKI